MAAALIPGMTNNIPRPRKGPLGQPTANGGHFAAQTNTAAPEGLLTEKRNRYALEQDGVARQARENVARADMANFCAAIMSEYPNATSVTFDEDADGDEIVWPKITLEGDDADDDDVVYKAEEFATELSRNYDFDILSRYIDQTLDIRETAAWDPTAEQEATMCAGHVGVWGYDPDCEVCTDIHGNPRVLEEPSVMQHTPSELDLLIVNTVGDTILRHYQYSEFAPIAAAIGTGSDGDLHLLHVYDANGSDMFNPTQDADVADDVFDDANVHSSADRGGFSITLADGASVEIPAAADGTSR